MMKTSLLTFGLSALVLTACEQNVQGTLSVQSPFPAKVSVNGRGKQVVTIAKGSYRLNVEGGPFNTRLTISDRSGTAYEFKAPSMKDLRKELNEGHVRLSAQRLKQEFDLDLSLDVKVLRQSADYWTTRSCVYDTYETCSTRCHPTGDGGVDCSDSCTTNTIYGTRDVKGHDITYQRKSVLKFIRGGSVVASMRDGSEDPVEDFEVVQSGACVR